MHWIPSTLALSASLSLLSVSGHAVSIRADAVPIVKAQPCLDHRSEQVHLSFDDGPLEPTTSKILDVLKKRNIKATFLLSMSRFPGLADTGKPRDAAEAVRIQLVERMKAEGHTIGSHAYRHVPHVGEIAGRAIADLEKSDEVMRKLGISAQGTPFRFPYGAGWFTEKDRARQIEANKLMSWVKAHGYQPFHWDAETHDWDPEQRKKLPDIMLSEICGERGGVLLMHANEEFTASSLNSLIDSIQSSGNKIVSFSEINAANEKNPSPWKSFRDSRDLAPGLSDAQTVRRTVR